MKKVQGVEDVHVSLENAFTEIWLRPGNSVTLAQLRAVIRRGGFTAGEAHLRGVATVTEDNGRLRVDLAPARDSLLLEADGPVTEEQARKFFGLEVEFTGSVAKEETIRLKTIARR